MSDPIDQLERFGTETFPTPHLPAAEVRRRGTRLRHRRQAAAGLGAALAVGLVVTPLALGAGRGTADRSPDPTTSVTETPWVRTIPRGFPIDDGMGDGSVAHVGTERGEVVFSGMWICGKQVWSPEEPASTDALGAVWSDGIEGGEQRTVVVYPSDTVASAALGALSQAVTGCAEPAGKQRRIQPVALESAAGEESLAYMDQYRDGAGPTGEGNAFVVTRVGNALLLDKTYFGGAGSMEVAQQTADLLMDRSGVVVDAMCVFAAEPCSE